MHKAFYEYIKNADRLFLKIIWLFAALLIVSQALLLKDTIRVRISQVDKLEGERISLEAPVYVAAPLPISNSLANTAGPMHSFRESRDLIIHMVKPAQGAEIYIIVNGKVIDDFHQSNVRLTVYEGDFVEIDATSVTAPAQFVIHVMGGKTASPMDGLLLESNGNTVAVGKIKFK